MNTQPLYNTLWGAIVKTPARRVCPTTEITTEIIDGVGNEESPLASALTRVLCWTNGFTVMLLDFSDSQAAAIHGDEAWDKAWEEAKAGLVMDHDGVCPVLERLGKMVMPTDDLLKGLGITGVYDPFKFSESLTLPTCGEIPWCWLSDGSDLGEDTNVVGLEGLIDRGKETEEDSVVDGEFGIRVSQWKLAMKCIYQVCRMLGLSVQTSKQVKIAVEACEKDCRTYYSFSVNVMGVRLTIVGLAHSFTEAPVRGYIGGGATTNDEEGWQV